MESNSAAMRTHCSTASALLLKKQAPKIPLKSRGRVKIKGKEKMTMYWVNGDGDIESGESEDIEGLKTPSQRIRAEKTNTVISSAAAVVVPELEAVTLSELTRRAKTAGMTLADFPNTYGARTFAELLSRGPTSGDEIRDDDATDYFLQSHQNESDLAKIEKICHDVAAFLGFRILSSESQFSR